MRKSSPLSLFYEMIAAEYGVQNLEPFEPSRKNFSLIYSLPKGTFPGENELQYVTWFSWDEQKGEIEVTTTPKPYQALELWDEVYDFLNELTDNVKIFFGDKWKGGTLWPFQAESQVSTTKIIVGYKVILCCGPADSALMKKAFECTNMCASQSLLLTRPIVASIAKTGRVPLGVEQIDIISNELERYERLAVAFNEKKVSKFTPALLH